MFLMQQSFVIAKVVIFIGKCKKHGGNKSCVCLLIRSKTRKFVAVNILNNIDMTAEEQQKADERYMRMALQEAERAQEEGEIPIGAVVVCRDRVIARAHNTTETLCDVTAHAEMLALTSAANQLGGKYLTDCTLYVTIEPCVMCAGAIGWAQVSRVVYGAADAKRGYSVYAPKALHPKTIVQHGVLETECAEIVQKFFKEKRN